VSKLLDLLDEVGVSYEVWSSKDEETVPETRACGRFVPILEMRDALVRAGSGRTFAG